MAPTSRNDANGRCHGDASAGIDELGDLDRDCCTIRRRLTCGADRWRCHRPSKHGGVRPSSIELEVRLARSPGSGGQRQQFSHPWKPTVSFDPLIALPSISRCR